MRFWLLGTWMADQLGLDFYLVNLVLDEREKDIVELFGRHIQGNGYGEFMRLTWDKLYEEIESCETPTGEEAIELDYLENKSLGYRKVGHHKGRLKKAFR